MKSIRTRILRDMLLTCILSLAIIGGLSTAIGYTGTLNSLKLSMTEMAKIGSERIAQQLDVYKTIAYEAGCSDILGNPSNSDSDKQTVIDDYVSAYGFQRGNVLDLSGNSIFDGNNYADREYFQMSLQGNKWVSEPLVSKITGELTIIISAPLWKNGVPNSTIAGVVYFVPKETFLNDIVIDIKAGTNGSSYILNNMGVTIAHKNIDNVLNQENTQEDAKTDAALKPLAAMELAMTQGKTSFG